MTLDEPCSNACQKRVFVQRVANNSGKVQSCPMIPSSGSKWLMDIIVRSSKCAKTATEQNGTQVHWKARNYVLSSVVTSAVLMTFLFLQISGQAETILNQ